MMGMKEGDPRAKRERWTYRLIKKSGAKSLSGAFRAFRGKTLQEIADIAGITRNCAYENARKLGFHYTFFVPEPSNRPKCYRKSLVTGKKEYNGDPVGTQSPYLDLRGLFAMFGPPDKIAGYFHDNPAYYMSDFRNTLERLGREWRAKGYVPVIPDLRSPRDPEDQEKKLEGEDKEEEGDDQQD